MGGGKEGQRRRRRRRKRSRDPLKSAERVQSREAMGAMGRDGTMEPWGHEPLRVRGMGP